jgi:hypothetical protein
MPHLNPLQRRGLEKPLLRTLSFGEGRVRLKKIPFDLTKRIKLFKLLKLPA